MPLPTFCKDTVTVLRPGTKVQRGVSLPDWDHATPHVIHGCSLQEGASATDFGDAQRNAIASDAMLLAPPNADIKDGDRVLFDSRTWTVDGVPDSIKSPTGRVSHVRARLKEWRG